eukprot:TRINITY_DN29412_c1_g2_i1.p1 TRINITY_DN29412_c1_g2~~TRINITY_DN29412_c1_g2_i1.p1  ORF type:complete len:786 (+),score=157.94 TRINITY_DN29412_c1_g2_i1:80-2359(+)
MAAAGSSQCGGSSSSKSPVLRGAAEAVAKSLGAAAGSRSSAAIMEVTRPLKELRDVLTLENGDVSEDAAVRCASLRSCFAAALRSVLAERPEGAALLKEGSSAPKVRVEVRQTAGRMLSLETFTVGRAAECDVQTAGDPTASRLQFVAVSLPAGIVIADAWSGGGTRVVRRSGPDSDCLPASVPSKRTVMFFPHGERVTLLTGAKTTVTIGPAVSDLPTQIANGKPVPRLPTPVLLQADAPAGASSSGSAAATPKPKAEAKAEPKAQPKVEPKAGPKAEPKAGSKGPAPSEANGSAAAKTLHAARTCVRMQQQAAMRERVRSRCRFARRVHVLSASQCAALQDQERLRGSMEEVRDLLDGLGVPPALDDPAAPGASSWSCSACKSSQRSRGWRCPFQHRFCRDCMLRRAAEEAVPTCPHENCGYCLGEADLQDLRVPEERFKVICQALEARRRGVQAESKQEQSSGSAKTYSCSTPGCGAAVVFKAGEARRAWSCVCGAAPVCTSCGVTPYHYHGNCEEVRVLRARWLAWLQGGREAYKGLQKRGQRSAMTQQRALKEALEHMESQQSPAHEPEMHAPAAKLSAAQAARVARAKCSALSGHGVRHLLAKCNLCRSGDREILGPRFRCLHCRNFNVCQKCETKVASEHPEGHVFQVMFEDDIDWDKIDVQLPRGIRARLRQRLAEGPDPVDEQPSRKRVRAGLCSEGILRGQKRGRYMLELLDGSETLEVAAADLQPLLTQKQAERLMSAGLPGLQHDAA